MTPEQLANITLRMLDLGIVERFDAGLMGEEIRRLWAERDARLLVGRPVDDRLLAGAKRWREAVNKGEAPWPTLLSKVELVDHIIFLERLLADADDLPQVRRTGYADGWKAAIDAAVAHFEKLGADAPNKHYGQWLKSYGQLVTGSLRELKP